MAGKRCRDRTRRGNEVQITAPKAWHSICSNGGKKGFSTYSAPMRMNMGEGAPAKQLICRGLLVDLIGIEPMTSSMPWNETNIKILTAKDLLVG